MDGYNVIIEFSRKCNMTCPHCLRGSACNKTMPSDVMQKIIDTFDYISDMTVGGGESSLAVKQIQEFTNLLLYGNKTEIGSVYVVTNGKRCTMGFLNTIKKLMDICTDNESSGLQFSYDLWHTENLTWEQQEKRDRNYWKARDYMDYRIENRDEIVGKHSSENWGYDSLINMGRAKNNGIGRREIKPATIDIEENQIQDEIYIT